MHERVGREHRVDAPTSRDTASEATLATELLNVIRLLRRRALLGLAIVGAALGAGLLYTMLFPPSYSATTILLSDPRQQRVVNSDLVLGGIGADVAAVESQVELLRSTDMARRVIAELALDQDPEFESRPGLLGALRPEEPHAIKEAKTIERFLRKLRVARRGLTYVLEVRFTSRDPEQAARIANMVSDFYVADQVTTKETATNEAAEWVRSRIDELSRRASESEQAVADFKAKHNIIDVGSPGSGQTLARLEMDRLNQQLVSAEADAATANAKVHQIERVLKSKGHIEELPDVLSSVAIQNLRRELARVLSREASMDSVLGPRHPALIQVREQKDRIQTEIRDEARRVLAAARSERDAALGKVGQLNASLNRMKKESVATDQVNVELHQLQRVANADRELHDQFLTRAKELSEQRDIQTPDARIIARALPPVRPTFPSPSIILLLALTGGLVAAFGTILVLDRIFGEGRRKHAASDTVSDFQWDTPHPKTTARS